MAITGYFIASATTPEALTTSVNQYIALDWQPNGPIVRKNGNADICQAMIQGTADAGSVSSGDISDATTIGKDLLTAVDAATAAEAIGALSATSTGSFETAADITTSGELKGENLEVTGTAKFDGTVEGLPAATTSAAGVVSQITNIAALTAAPTEADFNGLLTALQTAGIMAAS